MSLLLVAAVSVAAAPAPKTPEPKDFIKLLGDSPRKYQLDVEHHDYAQWAQQNAALFWPQEREELAMPKRVPTADGRGGIVEWPRDPDPEVWAKAEALFQEKEYAKAEALYAQVLKKDPNDCVAQLAWGDAALFDRRPKVALERYEAAIKLNPVDHHGWYYKGNALFALGKKKEAVDAYVKALARNPRHENMIVGLEPRLKQLGYVVRDTVMLPRARVTQTDDGVREAMTVTQAWLAWANCKAAWLGEPEFRKRMTGSDEHRFSILEEKQCLVNLAAAYASRDKQRDGDDPVAAQVLAVAEAHMLEPFVVYELASRVWPNVMATTDDAGMAAMEAYVRKFVLVKS